MYASVICPSATKGTNFQCPVCSHFLCSTLEILLRQYSFPFVVLDSSGPDAKATVFMCHVRRRNSPGYGSVWP
eukprot:1513514-Ditylum_brightwellii.AAC.1